MQRRKSFCIQSHVSQTENNEITRSNSFTLEATRRLSSSQERLRTLQACPIRRHEISPRRTSLFPGARLLRSSLGSFRRIGRPTPLRSPCVWVDTPKEDHPTRDASCVLSITGDSTRVKSFTESGTTDSPGLFPEEGVLSLSLHDTNHSTVFTLSRLPQTEGYGDSTPGTSLINTDRTESTKCRVKTQPLLNNLNSSRGVGIANSTCSGWDTISNTQTSDRCTLQFPSRDEVESIRTGRRPHPVELDSDFILQRIPNRSFSSVDFSRCASPFGAPSSDGRSPAAVPVRRPRTRFDSRLSGLNSNKRTDALPVSSRSDYSQITTTTMTHQKTPNSASKLPKSFRSDQFLFQDSKGRSSKIGMGEMNFKTSKSERNLCIGKRSEGIGSSAISQKPTHAIRRMQPHESLAPLGDNLGKCSHRSSNETKDGPLSVTEGSHWDDNECNSELDDPRSLAMWFDWLEERADLSRKEILYRMKCQKAFIRDANEELERGALMNEECKHLLNPTTKDRVRALRRKCLGKSTKSNNLLSLTDEEDLLDINLQEVDAPIKAKQQPLSLNLTP